MSLTAAQIFVRTDDFDTVERVVAEALAEWALLVGPPEADEPGAFPPPAAQRRIVLVPPLQGWLTIIEESGKLDRALARNVHARTGARVIAAELDGHFLTAELQSIDDSGDDETWSVPDTNGDYEQMPVYEDAEAGYWYRLRAEGVPAALIACDWEELVDTVNPASEGARLFAEAGVVGLEKTIVPFCDPPETDLVDGPRVRPDLWVAGPDGQAQVVEARRVSGEWNAAAVASLAAIEEAQVSRILATLAWTAQTDELPDVVFTYDGVDEPELFEVALNAARSTRPTLVANAHRTWLSIQGLEKAVRGFIAERRTGFEVGKECLDRLELRHEAHPTFAFLLDLRELWQAYVTAPDEVERVIHHALESLLYETQREETFDPTRLYPLMLGEGAPDLPNLAVRPLVTGVWVALGMDTGRALRPIGRETLRTSEMGFDDALALAISRLEIATEQHDEFVIYEQPEGTTIVADFPDVSTAARILSPAVLAHVAQQLGDECWVAIPTRDSFLAAEGTDEGLVWLEREVLRRYGSGDLALTPMIWSIQNGELVEHRPARAR